MRNTEMRNTNGEDKTARRQFPTHPAKRRTIAVITVAALASVGCKDLTKDPGLPAGTPDPAIYNTASGAIGLRAGAIAQMNTAIARYMVDAGLISDELEDRNTGASEGVLLQNAGTLTDPLDERILPDGVGGANNPRSGGQSYAFLQNVRGAANVALAALALYDTATARRATQRVMRGELYALEAYSEILLAELFCSGVPLSTLDFHGDFTYAPSSSSIQVYQDAIVKLDSAMGLATTNDSVMNLARLLKGRARLELGQYAAAADDVSTIPDAFAYRLTISLKDSSADRYLLNGLGTIADREGGNGYPFVTNGANGDARTATIATCTPPAVGCGTVPLLMPAKYVGTTTTAAAVYAPFAVGNGVEARLIEAEADLHAGGTQWLTILNALRTNGTGAMTPPDTIRDTLGVTNCGGVCGYDPGNGLGGNTPEFGQPYPGGFIVPTGYSLAGGDTVPGAHTMLAPDGGNIQDYCTSSSWYIPCYVGDSLVVLFYVRPGRIQWNAGTGGVNGLAPLADPGAGLSGSAATAARVKLLFDERAAWLFATGHRQGDLRRLLRQYNSLPAFQSEQQVYPTGEYLAPGTGQYGSDVTAPIPATEYANPKYHGCLDRNP